MPAIIYMPNSRPRPVKKTPPPPNYAALAGGSVASVAGIGAAIRFKDWLLTYWWVILLAVILLVIVIIILVKLFRSKDEEPEEE